MFETEEKLKLVYQDKGKFYPFIQMLEILKIDDESDKNFYKENITEIKEND